MNVTDLAVAPDGCVYFTTGGRGTQGGVFRIELTERKPKFKQFDDEKDLDFAIQAGDVRGYVQPFSAWGRMRNARAAKLDFGPERKWDRMLLAQLTGKAPSWNELGDESKNGNRALAAISSA